MSEEEKKGSGCWKGVAIGCVVLIILTVVGGYLAVTNAKKIGLWFGSKAVVATSRTFLDGTQLSAQEKAEIMVPIKELADKIKKGELSADQAVAIVEELVQGPMITIAMMEMFRASYVEQSDLPDEEKKEASLTVRRCMAGFVSGKIDDAVRSKIFEVVQSGSDKQSFKQTLTAEELNDCLKIMKKAADRAGITTKEDELKVDVASLVRNAIEDGLASTEEEE